MCGQTIVIEGEIRHELCEGVCGVTMRYCTLCEGVCGVIDNIHVLHTLFVLYKKSQQVTTDLSYSLPPKVYSQQTASLNTAHPHILTCTVLVVEVRAQVHVKVIKSNQTSFPYFDWLEYTQTHRVTAHHLRANAECTVHVYNMYSVHVNVDILHMYIHVLVLTVV